MKAQLKSDLLEALQVVIILLWVGSFVTALITCYTGRLWIATGSLAVFAICTGIIECNKEDFRLLED